MKRVHVLLAALVLVVAHLWALASTAVNRRHAHGGTVELTERELRLSRAGGESTVLFLEIEWDTLHDPEEDRAAADWLDAAKLVELGFAAPSADPAKAKRAAEDRGRTVEVYVAFEYEGDAWRQAPSDRRSPTRLFAVDAARDPHRLRERYPDASRHLIMRGLVRSATEGPTRPDGGPRSERRFRGYLLTLLPGRLFVPRPHNRVFEGLADRRETEAEEGDAAPRFAATVSWGARGEPWLTSVRRLDTHAAE